jgi:threonylcarbamoyladenosine tRNA methylthiotransferase MtaB
LRRRLESELGRTREVLIERAALGRTEHYLPVAVSGELPSVVRRLAIRGHDGERLFV